MAKFVVIGVLLALACGGSCLMQDDDIARAASKGDWDGVHELFKKYLDSRLPASPLISSSLTYGSALKSSPTTTGGLKKSPLLDGSSNPAGGRYYAQSEYSYARRSDINGKVDEDKGGLGVIDDNGKVTYYKPTPPPPFPVPGFGNQNGNGYGISPYGG